MVDEEKKKKEYKRPKRADGEGSIRKRADGRWEARYTDPREPDPKKRNKSIIRQKQKDVAAALKTVFAEITANIKPLVKDNPALSEWLSEWMREYKINTLRDTTYESYLMHIRTYINPIIGNYAIKNITGLQIQRMYNLLQEPKNKGGYGLGNWAIIKIKNILSGAIKQAMVSNIIRDNPLLGTSPPAPDDPDIRIMTKVEQQQFIAVLPFYNVGNMFAVALATGMRIGELCALDLSDIDREQKTININKTACRCKDKRTSEVSMKVGLPKTKYSIRKIPLLSSVEIMLDRQAQLVTDMQRRAGGNWTMNSLVFPTDEGNIREQSGLRTSLERVLKRAGLPHMTIHALRHTYATTALNIGVAAQNVAKLLGHKDGATTLKFYAHYIHMEAVSQLQGLDEQNISHLGITPGELKSIMLETKEALIKCGIAERIDEVVLRVKNMPPKKSVEQVLSVCADILCEPLDGLSANDKDVLLNTLAHYTAMKRQYDKQDKSSPKRKARSNSEAR